jgi:predicted Holliday junction resolvase-like endonuclease
MGQAQRRDRVKRRLEAKRRRRKAGRRGGRREGGREGGRAVARWPCLLCFQQEYRKKKPMTERKEASESEENKNKKRLVISTKLGQQVAPFYSNLRRCFRMFWGRMGV